MRVAYEASPALHHQAGLGRYTAGLLNALLHTATPPDIAVVFNQQRTTDIPPAWANLPRHASTLGNKPWRMRVALTYFGLPPMDGFVPNADLFHSTGHLLPRFRAVPTVFTLHDLIPLVLPQYHLPLNRIFFEVMFPRFLNAADTIIAVSQHTSNDAVRLLNIDPAKITVIPEGVEPHFTPASSATIAATRQRLGLPKNYLLIVTTIEPRKNHLTLLRAWEQIARDWPDMALVIAGSAGWLYEGFFAALEQSPAKNQVIVTGRVDDGDLPALLSGATVFAFPSLYEGFGLPPLEAMACGAPVVASSASSLPEAVGTAGVLLPPTETNAWATTLNRLLHAPDERAAMRTAGLAHAARYTWENAAASTLALYRRTLRR